MNDDAERTDQTETIDPLRAVVLGVSTLVLAMIFMSLLVVDQASAMAF